MDYSLPGSSVPRICQKRILGCVAISFSRGSSWPRGQTRVSCIAGRFFTVWATREAIFLLSSFIVWSTPRIAICCRLGSLSLQTIFLSFLELSLFLVFSPPSLLSSFLLEHIHIVAMLYFPFLLKLSHGSNSVPNTVWGISPSHLPHLTGLACLPSSELQLRCVCLIAQSSLTLCNRPHEL